MYDKIHKKKKKESTRWLSSKETTCKGGDSIQLLGWEAPPQNEMATLPSILAW